MQNLPHRPATLAIRRVQLLIVQSLCGGTQLGRRFRNCGNCLLAQGWRHIRRWGVLAYGITRIHPVPPVRNLLIEYREYSGGIFQVNAAL
jgi:hypothetical protein